MAKTLSEEVKRALRDIYYNVRTGRGKKAFDLLEQASEAGDGDATCILARCLCGHQYVWVGHGFPEDDKRASQLMRKSVEQGSALGVMLALRSGELRPSVRRAMPFANLQEAFDEVLSWRREGTPFVSTPLPIPISGGIFCVSRTRIRILFPARRNIRRI